MVVSLGVPIFRVFTVHCVSLVTIGFFSKFSLYVWVKNVMIISKWSHIQSSVCFL